MSDEPIRVGHPDSTARADDLCGACAGTRLATPRPVRNRPGLAQIRYRHGDHGAFKASMLAQLASSDHPALRGLGTRDDDDFSIALIDAWATVCDVLEFYRERAAHESYLGTADERLSVNELACLIGYRLHPGAAAETDLVVLMEDPPAAAPDVTALTVPAGTRVQSIPGPGEEAQTFETLADLDARPAWNALRPRRDAPSALHAGARGMWLAGQATGLTRGDSLLIAHPQRIAPGSPGHDPASPHWDVVRLVEVTPDAALDRTWVRWHGTLGDVTPANDPGTTHQVFALRRSAALFGHNAPHPLVLADTTRSAFGFSGGTVPSNSPSPIAGNNTDPGDWDFAAASGATIPLEGDHKDVTAGGWAVLSRPGNRALYGIAATDTEAEAKFAISGKTTRITPDRSGWVSAFADDYRSVTVQAGSEALERADTPLREPVMGNAITLDGLADDLPEGRTLILTGRRARLVTARPRHVMRRQDGSHAIYLEGTRMTLDAPPRWWPGLPGFAAWRLTDPEGEPVTTWAYADSFTPVDADETAPELREAATLARVEAVGRFNTRLVLTQALAGAYDRMSLRIHANVVRVSHGETTVEILGGGDPARPFQSATLTAAPVTHLLAPTETGVVSTLTLRIDSVAWSQAPDLYARAATARLFTTRQDDSGATTVQFGDGVSGARPPAGRDNIEAEYRTGLGRAGNLRAGQLSLALDRPLGLKEVTNPLPATGGADAEATEDARRGAPIHTLTLGRVVSLTDYRDFALGYPGIARADARWVWQGGARRIVVTVAGDDGAAVEVGGPVHDALRIALRSHGDPLVPFDLLSYEPARFRLGLKVATDPAHDPDTVLQAVETALRAAFAFDSRDFAQAVALSDVAATAQDVAGVTAVDIDRLYRESGPQSTPDDHMLLAARTGRRGDDGRLRAAEILTLSPDPLDRLERMT